MNYIILNGIKSTTVMGLIIQSLPPITKPLMRTQIDVIDGRDGDIVTPLGYSAYDKQITIGLYGDFDIDSVISFFNSSGTVIFSNEPDKYYKYAIYAQIDYEKLIRYRTATVTFHVQPFKYSASETILSYKNQFLSMHDVIKTANGVTAAIYGGVFYVSGTAASATEIYLPIAAELKPGSYILNAYAKGAGNCSARLIYNTTANSFGDGAITLQDNAVQSLSGIIAADTTYNYLYLYVEPGEINVTGSIRLADLSSSAFNVRNNGNCISKPTITVYGAGIVNLSLNNQQIFAINIAGDRFITIDAATMDAYNGSVLKNRSVTGDYNNFALPIGKSVIAFTGMVTQIDISNYSRWV